MLPVDRKFCQKLHVKYFSKSIYYDEQSSVLFCFAAYTCIFMSTGTYSSSAICWLHHVEVLGTAWVKSIVLLTDAH